MSLKSPQKRIRFNKTLGNSVRNSPMSPLSLGNILPYNKKGEFSDFPRPSLEARGKVPSTTINWGLYTCLFVLMFLKILLTARPSFVFVQCRFKAILLIGSSSSRPTIKIKQIGPQNPSPSKKFIQLKIELQILFFFHYKIFMFQNFFYFFLNM